MDLRESALALRLLELLDDHAGRVRQLIARVVEHLLADELGRQRPFGLVGEVVVGIEWLALGQRRQDFLLEPIHAVARGGRHRHDGRKLGASRVALDDRQQVRLADTIDLVQREHRWPVRLPHQIEHEPIARAGTLGDVDHQHDDVHLAQRVGGRLDHAPVHPVHRLVDARRVDEHDLPGSAVAHAHDPVTRGLRLVGDDRELLPRKSIEQRRLAGVRPADERHEAGLHSAAPASTCGARLRRRSL